MLKGKEVIGRRVVTLDGGERLDSVRDLIFDEQGNHVLALLSPTAHREAETAKAHRG